MPDFTWVPPELAPILTYEDDKYMLGCSEPGCTTKRQTSGKGSILQKRREGRTSLLFCAAHGGFSGKPTQEDIASWPDGHKRCASCLEIKPFAEFHKHAGCLFGYNTICKVCRVPYSQQHYKQTTLERKLFDRAKSRATLKGRAFTLTLDDVQVPEVCPILGVPIVAEPNHEYAPSLDRIDSSKGYTPDNVQVISRRANVLKNNMTANEAEALLRWFRETA